MVPSRGVKILRAKPPKAFWREAIPWAAVPMPWWDAKILARPCGLLPKPRCLRSWIRTSEEAKLFTFFSLRCFLMGRDHLWRCLTIVLVAESQNKDRTSKSHYIAKCTLWERFFPWSWPGLILIICRDIRLTPNDMVYVWIPWGMSFGRSHIAFHYLDPFLQVLSNLVEKWKMFQHFLPSFSSTKA